MLRPAGAAAAIEGVDGPVYVWRSYIDEPLRYYSDARLTAISPQQQLAPDVDADVGVAAALVLSHHTSDEEQSILGALAAAYVIGEPQPYAGISVYLLRAR